MGGLTDFPTSSQPALLEEAHLAHGGLLSRCMNDGIQFVTISFAKHFQVCAHSGSWPVIFLSCLWRVLESEEKGLS